MQVGFPKIVFDVCSQGDRAREEMIIGRDFLNLDALIMITLISPVMYFYYGLF